MLKKTSIWYPCDSRNDVESRVTAQGLDVFPFLLTDDPNAWGYAKLGEDGGTAYAVGYNDTGIPPKFAVWQDMVLVGVSEIVVSSDIIGGARKFEYKMPTIFHEFLLASGEFLLLRDEIGFALLSKYGEEMWSQCLGSPIQDFELRANLLKGTTFDGGGFEFEIPVTI